MTKWTNHIICVRFSSAEVWTTVEQNTTVSVGAKQCYTVAKNIWRNLLTLQEENLGKGTLNTLWHGRANGVFTCNVPSCQWHRSQLCAVTNGFSQSSEAEVFCPTAYSWEKKVATMERCRKLPRAWAIQSLDLAQLASSGTHWTAYQEKWQQAWNSISDAGLLSPEVG